jgi:predicted nuclease with TOPRIM domain
LNDFNKELYDERLKNTEKELQVLNEKTDKNYTEIVDLKTVVERVTTLLESTDRRIKTLEDINTSSVSFLETDLGKFVVKFFLFLIGTVVIFALFGKMLNIETFLG